MAVGVGGDDAAVGIGGGVQEEAGGVEAPEGVTGLGVEGVKAAVVGGDEDFAVGHDRFHGGAEAFAHEMADPHEAEGGFEGGIDVAGMLRRCRGGRANRRGEGLRRRQRAAGAGEYSGFSYADRYWFNGVSRVCIQGKLVAIASLAFRDWRGEFVRRSAR